MFIFKSTNPRRLIKKTYGIIPVILGTMILEIERLIAPKFLLYEEILIATILSFILSFLIIATTMPQKISVSLIRRFFQGITIGVLLFYIFSFSVIMNVDRSKSLYVLNWFHEEQPVSKSQMEILLIKKYGEYDKIYIEQRIQEQLERKVFQKKGNFIALTKLGSFYWNVGNIVARIFHLDGWFASRISK